MRWFAKSYLAKKIAVSVLLIILPFMAVCLLTFASFRNYIEESSERSAQQIVGQLVMNLESQFQELNRLTIYPLYESEILNVLTAHSDSGGGGYVTSTEERTVTDLLSSIQYDRSEIRDTLFFALDGSILSNQIMGTARIWDESNSIWMKKADDNPGGYVVIPPNACNYYTGEKNTKYMSVVRQLRLPFTLSPVGYVKIDLHTETFNKILSQVFFTPNSRLYVFNQYNELIFPPEANDIPALTNGIIQIDGQKYLSKISNEESTGLTIQTLLSEGDLQRDTLRIMFTVLTVAMLALILATFLAAVSFRRLARPIIDLRDKMMLVGEGKLDTRVNVSSNDEIGQLQLMFNNMVAQLDHLINEVYRVTISEKEAELSALQSQINPHFLYNTLETINMMAIIEGNTDITAAISRLGALLRYCVDNEQRYVLLSEELEYTRTYFDIQRMRNSSLKTLDIQAAPEALEYYVPKLILQPFIENVIEHARYDNALMIRITISLRDDSMEIGVHDNGKPVSGQTKAKIKRLLSADPGSADESYTTRKKGFGLKNVQKRLKLLFGREYGVALDENFGEGTGFLIRLKLIMKKEEAGDQNNVQDHDR